MRTDEFTFELPQHLIAQRPQKQRGTSRLLHVTDGGCEHRLFAELPGMLREHDLLILNNTRVIKARLFGNKESGGNIEVMVERILDEHEVLAQVRASKTPRRGGRFLLAGCIDVAVLDGWGNFFTCASRGMQASAVCWSSTASCPCPLYYAQRRCRG